MKKLLYKANNYLLLVLLATIFFSQQGCKKDESSSAAPVITGVRNYVASPGDSLLTSVGTGKWVVISGRNLKGALQIYFDGVKGTFTESVFSDTSAIVLMPAVIAFPLVPESELNTIRYVTTHGETTFSFPIVAPAPTISGISNESANSGDSVKINGFNFFFIKSVKYAGVDVTDYKAATDGTSISLMVPSGLSTSGGEVSVTTNSGSVTTVYKVHDYETGVLNNYDGVNNFSWGAATSNSSVDFPGNNGTYGVLQASNLAAPNTNWWERSFNLNSAQWIPADKLQDTLGNYAIKFEIFVKKPWVNGSIQIVKDYNFTYSALYRPWKNSDGLSSPFTTKGWQTVTIPLSDFVTDKGVPVSSMTDLVGSTGAGGTMIAFINDGSSVVADFEAAFDNVRVVKIK